MKILVAMSGGVDSTVTAYLLQKEGNEVVGVHFNFVENDLNTNNLDEISKYLGIKIVYKDYRKEFKEKVIDYFVNEYKLGRTPNPCAICNPTMKFEKLLSVMEEENCDMVATGHYANVATIIVIALKATIPNFWAKSNPLHNFCISLVNNLA